MSLMPLVSISFSNFCTVLTDTDPAVAALDLTKSRIGKLCTEANAFVISDALGESEFELDENEVTLTVTNMVGEWGVFIPDAAGAVAVGSLNSDNQAFDMPLYHVGC